LPPCFTEPPSRAGAQERKQSGTTPVEKVEINVAFTLLRERQSYSQEW
jgi:hypothetical protein